MNLVRIPTKWYNPHDTIEVTRETIFTDNLTQKIYLMRFLMMLWYENKTDRICQSYFHYVIF